LSEDYPPSVAGFFGRGGGVKPLNLRIKRIIPNIPVVIEKICKIASLGNK
jgi:hypothetical protein